jgi:hypothetical protein
MAILEDCRTSDLDIELTDNVGCSDASIIGNTVAPALRKKLLFLVMGPGTRSQPNALVPRFTHGRNETYDKESGRKAMVYISNVLCRLNAMAQPSAAAKSSRTKDPTWIGQFGISGGP